MNAISGTSRGHGARERASLPAVDFLRHRIDKCLEGPLLSCLLPYRSRGHRPKRTSRGGFARSAFHGNRRNVHTSSTTTLMRNITYTVTSTVRFTSSLLVSSEWLLREKGRAGLCFNFHRFSTAGLRVIPCRHDRSLPRDLPIALACLQSSNLVKCP